MKRWAALAIGIAVAVGCVRLGLWQLDRLDERRVYNADVERQTALEPVVLPEPRGARIEASGLAFRRAVASGRFELDGQVVEMARSHNGAPGVWVLTPLALPDGRRVLVNRGWVYSPDARTVDLARLVEPESTTARGVLVPPRSDALAVRPDTLDARFLPVILRRTTLPPGAPPGLVALDAPVLSDGPHLSYAVQWFAFGTIALVGGAVLFRRRDGPHLPT